jgi:hypothetical protein
MSLSEAAGPELPLLRRYARALTGAQRLGDGAVRQVPEALLADPELEPEGKQSRLTEWDSELDGRLNAEADGVSASDPISARKEARLVTEAGHVKTALTKITEMNTEKISRP